MREAAGQAKPCVHEGRRCQVATLALPPQHIATDFRTGLCARRRLRRRIRNLRNCSTPQWQRLSGWRWAAAHRHVARWLLN